MEYAAVIVAAAGAYAFGAVWYMANAKAWMAASGIESDEDRNPVGGASPSPFIVSAIMVILVAGMMRHVFVKADIDTIPEGFIGGWWSWAVRRRALDCDQLRLFDATT